MGIMDSAKNTHSADTHSADTHPNSRSDAQKSVQKSPQKSSQKSQLEERLTKNRERAQEELIATLDDENATFHREEALDDAFDRQVSEGRQRLARPRPQQFITGVMGGMEISLGILIGMRVTDLTGNQLVGGIAFSLGFIGHLRQRAQALGHFIALQASRRISTGIA